MTCCCRPAQQSSSCRSSTGEEEQNATFSDNLSTNDVVKPYSLPGRKTKAFQDLTICRVITEASQKNFPALTAADVEDPPVLPLTISNSLVSKSTHSSFWAPSFPRT
ncbi:hypothetical protein PFLUV_G00013890 [Perca fluviatilis]|uniref:Uncharacterized protein n=1 Tax=Perca fluviatilis TaxID=8168 RepID=A0A6A5FSL1_PERFL|nr:hypothetical protein PFLUV_G00013890 [Perca fluviatilis]